MPRVDHKDYINSTQHLRCYMTFIAVGIAEEYSYMALRQLSATINQIGLINTTSPQIISQLDGCESSAKYSTDLKHWERERTSRRTRRPNFLQASSSCHTDAPRKMIVGSRLRRSIKVSNENALPYFCGLILHLLPVDLELLELVFTTYGGCCYY